MTPSERGRAGAAAVLAKYGPDHYARMSALGAAASARRSREFFVEAGRNSGAAPVLRERLAGGLAPCASVRAVMASYGLTKREILSPSRDPELVACRVEIAALMRARGLSLREIGHRLNRYHRAVSNWLDIWRQVTGEGR